MRPTCPAVARVLAEMGMESATVALATLRVPGDGGARVVEGVRVDGTGEPASPSRVACRVPLPGWDTHAVARALDRAFPACEVFEVGYYALFLCPRRTA